MFKPQGTYAFIESKLGIAHFRIISTDKIKT